MPTQDGERAFTNLSDLLGPEENLQAARKDLFGSVSATVSSSHEVETNFDLSAFEHAHRPAQSVLQAKAHAPSPCLTQVREYALRAHSDQTLDHIHEPYWKHLAAVAGLVASSSCSTPRALALAWLQYTVTNTSTTLRDIERTFGNSIADGVRHLTESANPLISQSTRKQRDRQRLAAGDADVHSVKLADIAAHLASISHAPDLAQSDYLEEKRLEISVLNKGDESLKRLARGLWSAALKQATS